MAATSETPSLPAGGPPFPTPYFPSSNRQRRVPPRSRKNPAPSRGSTPMGQEGGEIPLAAEQPPGSISSSSTSSATAGPKPRRKAPKQQKWKSKEAFDDRLQGEGSSTPSSSGSLESTPSASADPKPKLNPNSKPFIPPGAGGRSAPSSSSSKVRMPPRSKAKQAAAAGGADGAQPKASKRQIEINPDLTPLSTQITQKLLDNAYECLICFENIGRSAVIWSCSNCYTVFHISCIKKWSASSINENKPWRCPGCQASFDQGQKPVGSCFCGKVPVPDFNPYQVPHSCGELCGRLRAGTDCPHPCNLICHPGPCPPCSAVGQPKPCFCGKKKFPLRCGEPYKGKSCGDPCGKTRACGLHFCDEICHAGSCSDCKVKFMQSCYCGRLREERFCGSGQLDELDGHDGSFSCEQVCNRVLSCGNHKCQQLCHSGACKPCETDASIVTKCPCGKKDAASLLGKPRESCLDPIPLCSSVCGKMLTCGLHLCEAKCHHGECAPCQAKIDVACRCGSSKTKRVCSTVNLPPGQQREPITCDRVCNTLRNCGRHRCSNKCCSALRDVNDPEGAHICRLTCGKRMTCGVHKCELLCHKGRCPPCNMASYTSLRCRCGKTVRNPPIPCGDDQLPDCPHPCNREHSCDHPVLHNCHNNEECPPCVVLVSKPCMGRHEIRKNVPCYLKDVSCGRTCARTLSCGVHTCQRLCHNGPCETNAPDTSNTTSSSSFRSCGQLCGRERQACDHLCQALCHPGQPCPDVVCKEMMTIKCACGRTSGRVRCMRGGGNYDSEDRVWPCDDRCEIEKRNKRLAEALGVSNVAGGASVSTLFQKPPPYSSNLLAMASSPFIQKTEKVFSDLISSPTLNTHSFPPMNASQRQLIHELAFFYGLDTASYDVEPRRNVVVTKRAHSKVPGVLLSQMPGYLQQHQHVQQQLQSQQQYNPLLPPSSGIVPPNHLANASVESSLIEWAKGKPCLHIYELSLTTKTQHIASYFRDFSVQIRWLDDNNALVVFPDETTMKTALNLHPPGQVYKCKFYRDVADFDLTPFKATPLAPTLAQALASTPQPKKTADVWSKNESFFAALKKKESASSTGAPSTSSSSSLIWEQTGVSRPLLDVDNLKVETKSLKEKEPEVSPLLNCSADDWTALLDDEDEPSSSSLSTSNSSQPS